MRISRMSWLVLSGDQIVQGFTGGSVPDLRYVVEHPADLQQFLVASDLYRFSEWMALRSDLRCSVPSRWNLLSEAWHNCFSCHFSLDDADDIILLNFTVNVVRLDNNPVPLCRNCVLFSQLCKQLLTSVWSQSVTQSPQMTQFAQLTQFGQLALTQLCSNCVRVV